MIDLLSSPRMPIAQQRAQVSLTVTDVEFARAGETIFGPLSFALTGGQLCAVGGANGAGKTTLLQVLAGLLAPTSGSIMFGFDRELSDTQSGGRVALLGHHNGLKLDLSARSNLRYREALMGADEAVSIDGALAEVGLEGYETLALRELSAGQRRRVALAALARNPAPVWLLDEPFANLDAHGRTVVTTLLARQRSRGGLAVITTHGVDSLPGDAVLVRLGGTP